MALLGSRAFLFFLQLIFEQVQHSVSPLAFVNGGIYEVVYTIHKGCYLFALLPDLFVGEIIGHSK